MTDQLTTVTAPKVNSLAKPTSVSLLAARRSVQRSPAIQKLFGQAAVSGWEPDVLADKLTLLLSDDIEGELEEIFQAALYLADEYLQIGDSMLIISTETGQAITRITEADLWQPPDVPREGGGMARPLPRLNPKLEGFLIQWEFEKARDKDLTADLTARLPQTDLLRQEGDRRLLVASGPGRKHIVDALRESLPELLPDGCRGDSRRFLDRFNFADQEPEGLSPLLQCVGYAEVQTPVVDPKAMNLRHDHYTSLRAKVAVQWARVIALSVALAAHSELEPGQFSIDDPWPPEGFRKPGYGYWVAEPNTAQALVSECFSVPGAPTVCLRSKAGTIVIDPESFECDSRERLGSWDVRASFKYTVYMDWDRVLAFSLADVPISGVSVA